MNREIDLNAEYLTTIKRILQAHLPPHAKTWVFGSRVLGTAKKFSDIDLLIDLGKPIPLDILAQLSTEFEESDLPYKVDVADAQSISPSFYKVIQKQLIPLS